MIYGSWFRNKMEINPEIFEHYDKGEGLYYINTSGNVLLCYAGEVIPGSAINRVRQHVVGFFGKKVKKIETALHSYTEWAINLRSVYLPNVEELGGHVFWGCKNLKNIYIPKVRQLEIQCFHSITTFHRPLSLPSLETLGDSAFASAQQLPHIDLPKLQHIPRSAFIFCTGLASISVPLVQNVGIEAFSNCKSLTTLDLPNALSVSYACFNGCTSLVSIKIPKVEVIDNRGFCFRECKSLKNITCKRGMKGIIQNHLAQDRLTQQVTITEV